MGIEMVVNWQTYTIAALSLALFGVGYNWLIDHLNDHLEGYTFLLVVGGCLATLIGAAAIIGMVNTLLVAGLFAASGAPMCIGALRRVILMRERVRDEQKKAVAVSCGTKD